MTTSIERFEALLQAAPEHFQQHMAHYWNFRSGRLDCKGLSKYVRHASSGEAHLAQFFGNLWLGSRDPFTQPGASLHFDLLAATSSCDHKFIAPVRLWMIDPFYP